VRDSGKYSHIEMRITEGRNRQVRRMVEAVGSKVLKLVRTAIGHIEIGDLKIGTWRELTPAEVARLCGQGVKKSASASPTQSGKRGRAPGRGARRT
jgi:16S rRNA U516 pseudouridylate synthase RsuA-like enzyme